MSSEPDTKPPVSAARLSYAGIALRGAAMGAADVVPGVSGGTMALITGIYLRLIDAIKGIDLGFAKSALGMLTSGFGRAQRAEFARQFRERDMPFLLTLLAGIGTAIVLASRVIPPLIADHPAQMRGLFFGMILASLLIPWRMMQRHGLAELLTFAVMAAFAYWFTSLGVLSIDAGKWFLFVSGAVAICAMILPGISGAFLLLILGQYERVIGAIHERDLVTIAVFGAGALVGITSFSRGLSLLLHRFHSPTMAALLGLMVGSMGKIWPYKDTSGLVEAHGKVISAGDNVLPFDAAYQGAVLVPALIGAAGFGVVLALERLGRTRTAPSDAGMEPAP